MSTSPSRSPVATSGPSASTAAPPAVSPFPYAEVPAGARRFMPGRVGPAEAAASGNDNGEDAGSREAQIRELGRQSGLAEGRQSFDEHLARERSTVASAVTQFAQERAAYYAKVEAEVVQLALAVARKILHREAQLDPLLLAAIVRVVLEKMEGATQVTLLVHPQQAQDWRRYLALHMEPGDLPEMVEDPAMAPDGCVLRTSMGTAQLGIEVQLKEIERGLMDLLAARPEAAR